VADPKLEREETALRIRTLRRARSISIQKLAASVGMSAGYLSEVERGHSAASGEKLARIAGELGVNADYLLTGRSEGQADPAIQIPHGLSQAAETLDLSYAQTVRLLAGRSSLVARRSSQNEQDWTKEDWIQFFEKVKLYL